MIARLREHRLESLLVAALGLWFYTLLAEGSLRLTLPPLGSAVILVGGTLSALIVYLSGLTSSMARRSAAFWRLPGSGLVVEVAVTLTVAFTWGFVLLVLFGTRPDR